MKTPHADLTNLYPYCDYEMRVCAYNSVGDGYDTDVATCQTLEDGNYCKPSQFLLNATSFFNIKAQIPPAYS